MTRFGGQQPNWLNFHVLTILETSKGNSEDEADPKLPAFGNSRNVVDHVQETGRERFFIRVSVGERVLSGGPSRILLQLTRNRLNLDLQLWQVVLNDIPDSFDVDG